jgi:hypothetical protein
MTPSLLGPEAASPPHAPFTLDRSALTIGSFEDEPDDLAHWLGQPAETRLAGIEFLRRQFYSDEAYAEAGPELRRLLEVTERPRS